jgi:hypothetical protein
MEFCALSDPFCRFTEETKDIQEVFLGAKRITECAELHAAFKSQAREGRGRLWRVVWLVMPSEEASI